MGELDPDIPSRSRPELRGDLGIAELAGGQFGVVSRRQLEGLGLSPATIDWRLAMGRLHLLHRGVYSVGHEIVPRRGRWLAAVMSCGPGAVLSHLSAAALWGIRGDAGGPIDVSVPERRGRARVGIRLHRPRRLCGDECTRRDRIPVTTVSRTLLDSAALLSARQLQRSVDEADRLGLLELRNAEEVCLRHPHRSGLAKLRGVLGSLVFAAPVRSPLEQLFLELCRDAGLPTPLVNVEVVGLEVDALWPAQRLVVELDGHEFHRTRSAFEADRARDARLQSAGYRVIRLTWRRLEDDRERVVAQLRRMLA